MRVVVVGGGILGLATARLLAGAPGRGSGAPEVVLLEKEAALALHQTSHNSGVAHTGIYYAPGSLKAQLCRRGLGLMREFCLERGLGWEACGKLVVASDLGEVPRLQALAERGSANGVPGLRWLSGGELASVEPHARGVAALHSPETAIVDFAAVARALGEDLVAAGGSIRLGFRAERVVSSPGGSGGCRVELTGGGSLRADRVVVCAGLHADRLARASEEPAEPRIVPFRGEYWQLRPSATGLVRGLIYPVPDPALPFLGVHLTRRLDGGVLIGPNAVLATAREGYTRGVISMRDVVDTLSWPGTPRLMRRHWRAGASELVRSASRRRFLGDAARYVPALRAEDVVRAPAGVRAQAVDRDGSLVDDFRVDVRRGVVWVRNAPSPAATSALAIAEELAERALSAI